jgi:molybdopterin-binding protein
VVNLNLAVGTKAFALVKASSIILATEMDDVRVLGLVTGTKATAIFKASSVLVGVSR